MKSIIESVFAYIKRVGTACKKVTSITGVTCSGGLVGTMMEANTINVFRLKLNANHNMTSIRSRSTRQWR